MLRSKLAPGARCALEHGGVAPVIVAADADLAQAVPRIAKGGFYHAGQVCVSVQRVFADAKIAAVHAGLKLTPDQEKLWPPVEAAVVERIHQRLLAGLPRDASGRPQWSITLPDDESLRPLAESLARLTSNPVR